ncbi:hypothetical protein [Paramagnetospirillum marisnigri]|uniref:hypothetical protein n=1 Tax=Paramagnetospirillum marisnigri TaxID=1285242 RepID=UPI000AE9E430|nr:hypothetical protein [Paramagnetospirillum marisnigri]
MPDAELINMLSAVAPGSLPAAAILWVWQKLDRRILELEILFKRLPCNFEKECDR